MIRSSREHWCHTGGLCAQPKPAGSFSTVKWPLDPTGWQAEEPEMRDAQTNKLCVYGVNHKHPEHHYILLQVFNLQTFFFLNVFLMLLQTEAAFSPCCWRCFFTKPSVAHEGDRLKQSRMPQPDGIVGCSGLAFRLNDESLCIWLKLSTQNTTCVSSKNH